MSRPPAPLRVAMIGAGFMGKVHSSAYQLVPAYAEVELRIEPVVLVDAVPELAERSARAFGFPEHATDWHEVVGRDDVDAVDIVGPNDTHCEIAVAAAGAGKHVLCEKPLARNLGEAVRMVEAVEQAEVANAVAFNYRHTPAIALARELVLDVGPLFQFRGTYLQDWPVDPESPWTWRFSKQASGSGALGDIGSHLIDYAHHLVGPIVRVCAVARTFVGERGTPAGERRPVDVDDVAAFLAEFEGGAVGTLESSRFATGRKNALSFELHGAGGALRFDWDRREVLWHYDASAAPDRAGYKAIECGPRMPLGAEFWPIAGIGFGFLEAAIVVVREFALACHGLGGSVPTFREGLAVERVIDAVLRSSEQSQWVDTGVVS